jgi:hypothetical protein
VFLIKLIFYFLVHDIRVRVRTTKEREKKPAQPEWPEQDRKILRRCMSLSPYKPQTPSEDKVAVL